MPENKLQIPDPVLLKWRKVLDLLAEFAGVTAVTINVPEEDGFRVLGASTGRGQPFEEGDLVSLTLRTYCAAVLKSGKTLVVPDARRSAYWKSSASAKAGLVAYAGVPIFTEDGKLFGSICLLDRKPNRFGGPVIPLMEEFAGLIASRLALLEKNAQLERALKEVRTLRGLVPICAECKKIRDDKGYWQRVEVYIENHSHARFSHGLCEDCIKKLYGREKWYSEPENGRTAKGREKRK